MRSYFKYILTILVFIASLMFIQTVLFYVWKLTGPAIIISTVLATCISIFVYKFIPQKPLTPSQKEDKKDPLLTFSRYCLSVLYLVGMIKIMLLLYSAKTFNAIQTPWEVVSSNLLIYYFALTALLIFIVIQKKSKQTFSTYHILLLTSLQLFITYSVVFFVYGYNFGFDPFIHQATEKILSTTGTITPKPLLYIGQYSLVTWLSKITTISIPVIDRLFLPLLAGFFIPPLIYQTSTKAFKLSHTSALLTVLTFPILLLPFYFSVPQNLGNLFIVITVLLSLIFHNIITKMNRTNGLGALGLLWLLGFVTFFIHPFSGIPLLIYLAIYSILKQNIIILHPKIRLISLIIILLVGMIALPLALTIGGGISNVINIGFAKPVSLASNITIGNWVPFYSIFHLVYLFAINHTLVLALLACLGLWLSVRTYGARSPFSYQLIGPLLFSFLILSINASLIQLIDIPIISYELPEFISRFWQIGLLFLFPLIIYGLGTIINNLLSNKSNFIYKSSLVFFLSLICTISLYLTYPRDDNFVNSRAFATSKADIEAVNWIEQDSENKDYVVLANQAVSAAALQEIGFKKYYNDALFFYPIPTTSPLYELYLGMVYDSPTKKLLESAVELTQADIVYFVINDYWLDSEKIITAASESIGKPYIIADGKIAIFKFVP